MAKKKKQRAVNRASMIEENDPMMKDLTKYVPTLKAAEMMGVES
jgi:hypothetical protein